MLRWIAKSGKALWSRLSEPRANDVAANAGKASDKIKDAPLRATVAAENALARRKTTRRIMVERSLGEEFARALKERTGKGVAVTTTQARNPAKLVRKAIAERCDALVIDADRLKSTKKARGRASLTVCAIEGTRRGGERQAGEDAGQTLEALTRGRPGADVGVFRGQGTWMETPGPRANLPDWLETIGPLARWAAGLGGVLGWVGLGGGERETNTGGEPSPGPPSETTEIVPHRPTAQVNRLQAQLTATRAHRAKIGKELTALDSQLTQHRTRGTRQNTGTPAAKSSGLPSALSMKDIAKAKQRRRSAPRAGNTPAPALVARRKDQERER